MSPAVAAGMRNTDGPTKLATLIAVGVLTASSLLTPSVVGATAEVDPTDERASQLLNSGSWLDTQNRQAVIDSFDAIYSAPTPEMGWTGDHDTCDAGTISLEYRQATIDRVNWFRSIAGVPRVNLDLEASELAQNGAIIASASNPLTHYPTSDATCYSAVGAEATASSNLSRGSNGPRAIDRYMRDSGDGNENVYHRNWILNPAAQQFGTADVPSGPDDRSSSNALRVVQDSSAVSSADPTMRERGWVAWPARGFVPVDVVFERWSFGIENADMTGASVTTQEFVNASFVAVESAVVHFEDSDGPPLDAIVWEPAVDFSDGSGSRPFLTPALDRTFRITISDVVIGATSQSFTYDVTVIGNQEAERPAALPTPAPQGLSVGSVESFIHRAHNDFLVRDATEVELAEWSTRLAAGTPRGELVAELAKSSEWIGVVVERMYEETLGRRSDTEGRGYWITRVRGGLTIAEMAAEFYSAAEYVDRSTREAWITDVYNELLGRNPDSRGLAFYLEMYEDRSPAAVALSIYQSEESRRVRVQDLYRGFLGRDSDKGGEDFWALRLNDGNDLALAANLAASDEYYRNASL